MWMKTANHGQRAVSPENEAAQAGLRKGAIALFASVFTGL
jgi:hypothetical protein